jgi:hypothetical protein
MESQRRFLRSLLTVVMLLGVASSPLRGVRPVHAQAVGADEQFWTRFVTFISEMEAVVGANPKVFPAGFAEGVAQIRQRVSLLTPEEWTALRGAYSGNQSFWDIWKTVGPVLEEVTSRPPVMPSGHLMSHSCPSGVDLEVLLALRATVTATSGAYNILQATEPDVFGVKVASGILAGVALAAQLALDVLEFDQARSDACEDDNHATILHNVVGPRTDVTLSSRASQTSLDALRGTLQAHSTDMTNLVNMRADLLDTLINLRANVLDAKLQTQHAEMSNLVNTRATFIDATLANVSAKMAVNFDVIELKKKQRFLLVTNEAGVPVNAVLISVKASDLKQGAPLAFQDVTANATVTPASLGLLDVNLDLPKAAKDATVFEFRVRHSHGVIPPLGNVGHVGIAVFISNP